MPNEEPNAPTEPESPEDNVSVRGNLEDDSSRRRRRTPRRRPQPGGGADDPLECSCLMKRRSQVSFKDIAGNEEAKGELMEVSEAMKNPEPYDIFGAGLPRGVLFCGKPGVGKTFMASALANSMNAPFYHVVVSQITSKWFGESEKNLQKVFDHARLYCEGEIDISPEGDVSSVDVDDLYEQVQAEVIEGNLERLEEEIDVEEHTGDDGVLRVRASEIRRIVRERVEEREHNLDNRYAIIFFDEIDALGASRDNTPFQGGVSNRIVSVLLENLDGIEATEKIVVIASTNRLDAVDPALRRAGRFDRIIRVDAPDEEARQKILEIHLNKAQERAGREFANIDWSELTHETKNLVGSDLAEVVREACQTQAKRWRDAEEDDRDELLEMKTEDLKSALVAYQEHARGKKKRAKMGFSMPGEGKSELCETSDL